MKNLCHINYPKLCTRLFLHCAVFSKFLNFALSSLYGRRVICGFFEILISFLIFTFFLSLIYGLNLQKQVQVLRRFTNICHLSTNQRAKKGTFRLKCIVICFSFPSNFFFMCACLEGIILNFEIWNDSSV